MLKRSPIQIQWVNESKDSAFLQPLKVDFNYSHNNYDFLRCEFGEEAAHRIKNNIELLGSPSAAQVFVGDTLIRTMYFHPDYLKLGEEVENTDYAGSLELHDLHEHLKTGTVKFNSDEGEKLQNIYRKIYSYRNQSPDLFNGYIVREKGKLQQEQKGIALEYYDGELKYDYSVSFTGDTPLQAIKRANKQYGVTTHISKDGELVIGGYRGQKAITADRHGASADFQLGNLGINQRFESGLESVYIEGPAVNVHATDVSYKQKFASAAERFNPIDSEEYAGLRLQAKVTNTNVVDGENVSLTAHKINDEEVVDIALRKYQAVQSAGDSGTITLNPEVNIHDGNDLSDIKIPLIGDALEVSTGETDNISLLETAPVDDGIYYINGVTHIYDSNWTIEVDVGRSPAQIEDLQFEVQYKDAGVDDYYKFKDLHGYKPDTGAASYGGMITYMDSVSEKQQKQKSVKEMVDEVEEDPGVLHDAKKFLEDLTD